jgi:hypothetical protein
MRARQILAPPHGFVWLLSTGRGTMRLTGSDGLVSGRSWSRFWLLGMVPVGRAGGNADHLRSAFARAVAETMFWAPAALLPGEGVEWEAAGPDAARATLRHDGLSQAVEVTVDADGRPTQVAMARWTDANPERVYRLQPFGGYLSDFREFEGFLLPTRVEGGNMFGTGDYFPFYRVEVTDIRFLP